MHGVLEILTVIPEQFVLVVELLALSLDLKDLVLEEPVISALLDHDLLRDPNE